MGIALLFLGYAVSGRESGRASRLPAGPVAAVWEEGGGEARRRSGGRLRGVDRYGPTGPGAGAGAGAGDGDGDGDAPGVDCVMAPIPVPMVLSAVVMLLENVTKAAPIATAMTPTRIAYSRADTASLARRKRRSRRD